MFMPLWVEDILGIPAEDTAYLEQQLPLFLNDTIYGFKHPAIIARLEGEHVAKSFMSLILESVCFIHYLQLLRI